MKTFSKKVSLAFDDCGEGREIALTAFFDYPWFPKYLVQLPFVLTILLGLFV